MRNFVPNVKAQDARAAIRVGASVGIPLFAIYGLGRLDCAVYAAFGALCSLYGHSETVQRRIETQLVAGLALVATLIVAALYSVAQGPLWLLGILLALVVVIASTIGAVMKWVPRGEIFFILVLLVIAGIPVHPYELPLRIAAGIGGAVIALALTAIEPHGAVIAEPVARRLRARAGLGAAGLDVKVHVIVIAAAVLGTLAAWLLALALKIGHPFWAPITVAALIPAIESRDATRRAAQLLIGTTAGVCFAAVLFSQVSTPLALIIIITLAQGISELLVARSYAAALVFFCPLAIGMNALGRGLPWAPLVAQRLEEAALGTVVALVTIILGRLVLERYLRSRATA